MQLSERYTKLLDDTLSMRFPISTGKAVILYRSDRFAREVATRNCTVLAYGQLYFCRLVVYSGDTTANLYIDKTVTVSEILEMTNKVEDAS